MAQRKKSASVDEAAIEAEIRAELASDGVVKLARIKPVELRARLVAKLEAEGVEATKAALRRPLVAQLKEALAHGAPVSLKAVSTHVRGGSPAELKGLVEQAVREGVARRVQRGTVEVLVGAEVAVLSAAELKVLRDRLVGLTKTLEKVLKKPALSLLESDVAESLNEASRTISTRKKPEGGDAMQAVLAAVDATRDERTGLSFVPAVVGRLAPAWSEGAAVKLLVAAAERELVELRPEGGIGRLSAAELAVCPPGPHQTRLSWARRLEGAAR
jgi:hypothetical protein